MGAKTPIPFKEIPDRMFMPAIKVREIVRARPLKYEERKNNSRGAPDIFVEPLIGKPYYLSRQDVINHFTYLNRKKIKTTGWESSKKYVIYRDDNTLVKAMQVPLNHTIDINGVTANSSNRSRGDYIVCMCNEDGTIDRGTASVVSAAIFRKLCYIPMNETIAKHQGSRNTLFSFAKTTIAKHVPPAVKSKVTNMLNRGGTTPTKSNIPNRAPVMPNHPVTGVSKAPLPSQVAAGNSAGFEIIAQVHDAFGKRVGFILKAPSGETRQLKKQDVINMAIAKKLSNATVVKGPSGEPFLRGVGVQLDNLPIEYI